MQLPVWITDIPRLDNWDYYYQDLINQHASHSYVVKDDWSLNNFYINDPDGVWDKLYQQFLNRCIELFGPLTLNPNNSRKCWLYTSNKDHYLAGIHNHHNTSMINGVYYFSVPASPYFEGLLSFYNRDNIEIWSYKPREQDLVIFPGFLNHQPSRSNNEKFRFAINMEILCDWPSTWLPPPN